MRVPASDPPLGFVASIRIEVFDMLRRGRRATAVLGLVILSAACAGPSDPSRASESNGPAGTTGDSAVGTVESAGGLRSEFLALVFPVDPGDFDLAYETYEAAGAAEEDLAVAQCVEDQGFRTLAALLKKDLIAFGDTGGMWMFPDLTLLRTHGGRSAREAADHFMSESEWPTWVLFNNIIGGDSPEHRPAGVGRLSRDLEAHPQVGVQPSDAEALYDAMIRCERDATPHEDENLLAAHNIRFDWLGVLVEIDQSTEVTSLEDALVACLREIDPRFNEVESGGGWVALMDGLTSQMFEDPDLTVEEVFEQLHAWDEEYADCVEPTVTARRPLRLEARSEAVDAQLAQLLELQKLLDADQSGS